MQIQIYTYLNNPSGSICNVAANWSRVLSAHHEVKIKDFSGDCRFGDLVPLLGEFDGHISKTPVGIYIAYPSYAKTYPMKRHTHNVGVFVCESDLNKQEYEYIKPFNMVVVPSQFCKGKFLHVKTERELMVINHGIDPCFQPMSVGKPKDFTYLFIFNSSYTGGSETRKNVMNLLRAFRSVKKEIKEARLILKTLPSVEIDLPGMERRNPGLETISLHLEKNKIVELYNKCHVYVNPSSGEGFGITPLEAMACGTPVVSPIHTGLSEFLSKSNCVFVPSEKGNIKFTHATNDGPLYLVGKNDLARAMVLAYNSYNQLVENAFSYSRYARDRFSWPNVMKEFLEWLT